MLKKLSVLLILLLWCMAINVRLLKATETAQSGKGETGEATSKKK